MTNENVRAPLQRNQLAVAAVLMAVGAILIAAAVHVAVGQANRRAASPGNLADRVSAAKLAAVLEPWNARVVERARVLQLWALGDRQLASGDYNSAVDTLQEAYARDVGNAELLALFRRAQDLQALETNRKAHLQHGHEGPGGTLRPQDIER